MDAAHVIWPVSPHRVVALSRNDVGEKAVIREATGQLVGIVRDAVEQGRERMIFASEAQRDRLPAGKRFRRRTQVRLRCSDRGPHGEYIAPPGCVVKMYKAFADKPAPYEPRHKHVLRDRPELPTQEQPDELARYIREQVIDNFKQIYPRLDQLKADIEQANNLTAEMATDAYNKVNTDIDQLRRELDQSQALDLRWAIFGLYIATIGVALGYWA